MPTLDESDETHDVTLPDVAIVIPDGPLPVVREGTIGGIPAYESNPESHVVHQTASQ